MIGEGVVFGAQALGLTDQVVDVVLVVKDPAAAFIDEAPKVDIATKGIKANGCVGGFRAGQGVYLLDLETGEDEEEADACIHQHVGGLVDEPLKFVDGVDVPISQDRAGASAADPDDVFAARDGLVLEGDLLQGLEPAVTRANLTAIARRLKARRIGVVLAGMVAVLASDVAARTMSCPGV